MRKYIVTVYVRQHGAIGVFYRRPFVVTADTEHVAMNAAIDAAHNSHYETRGVSYVKAAT